MSLEYLVLVAYRIHIFVCHFFIQLYDQCPTLMSLLPGKHQTAFASMSKLKPFIQEEIRKHKEDRDPFNPRDYIDCYLDEIEKVGLSSSRISSRI